MFSTRELNFALLVSQQVRVALVQVMCCALPICLGVGKAQAF